jgi:hypothetical protein
LLDVDGWFNVLKSSEMPHVSFLFLLEIQYAVGGFNIPHGGMFLLIL